MPIQLDKILADVAQEKSLKPNSDANKIEIDDAWARVSKKNALSVHEARSIFKVLQKKYEQEKLKERSAWKLFQIMEEIHQVQKPEPIEEKVLPMEEDEEYEMLEVQEEEEMHQQQHQHSMVKTVVSHSHSFGGETSEADSPVKTSKCDSSNGSTPERKDKQLTTTTVTTSPREEKKLLNSLVSPVARSSTLSPAVIALQKKGITMKKATPNTPLTATHTKNLNSPQPNKSSVRNGQTGLEIGKTIQLPESLKRKLSEEPASTQQTKKLNANSSNQNTTKNQNKSVTKLVKKDDMEIRVESSNNESSAKIADISSSHHHGINLITIPANPNVDISGAVVVNGGAISTSTNGNLDHDRIEDIKDIVFDPNFVDNISINTIEINKCNPEVNKANTDVDSKEELINLGNMENALPRTFFKNLCNSERYEALGLYVANAMNRLNARAAARLELNILSSIIEAQKEVLNDK